MKHRILAAMLCVCLALTSLCIPAFADDTEAVMPVSVKETPAPVEATPAPAEETPAPVEETPMTAAEVQNEPVVQANDFPIQVNGKHLEENKYYKNDPNKSVDIGK